MKRKNASIIALLVHISVLLLILPKNVLTNDEYLQCNNDDTQCNNRDRNPFLINLKEWLEKISDPLSKCIQPQHESSTGIGIILFECLG